MPNRSDGASGIRGSISSPRVPRIAENLIGPPWEDVRRVIASIGDSKARRLTSQSDVFAFSIYGLRSAEVRGLTLEDIDWRQGSITCEELNEEKPNSFRCRTR